MNWEWFFPPRTPVLALPSWSSPRLYLPARGPLGRWRESSFYPASRLRGRAYRLLLRAGAAAGVGRTRIVRSGEWSLGNFAREALPVAESAAVLAGEPSPVQKITARLLDARGEVVGYVKYAEQGPARRLLRREHSMLSRLPTGVGPTPLRYGPLGEGEALLTTPLPGRHLPAALPPEKGVSVFVRRLVVSPPVPLEAHPWVRNIRRRSGLDLDPWLETLEGRGWPIVVQHGDLAPWNMLKSPGGALGAVDWEYGSLEGFPHLDTAHFMLQVSVLVHRWRPGKATEFAARYFGSKEGGGLDVAEARTMVRLAAHDVYLKHLEDGYARDPELRRWLRAVWEEDSS